MGWYITSNIASQNFIFLSDHNHLFLLPFLVAANRKFGDNFNLSLKFTIIEYLNMFITKILIKLVAQIQNECF